MIDARFAELVNLEFPGLIQPRLSESQALIANVLGVLPKATASTYETVIAGFFSLIHDAQNLANLSDFDATSAVGKTESIKAWADALQAQFVVAAVGEEAVSATSIRKGSDVSLEDIRSTELGAFLNISPNAARNLSEHCRHLVRWLPVTLGHLQAGNIDSRKARVISDGSFTLFCNLQRLDDSISDVRDNKVMDYMQRFEALVTRRIASRNLAQVKKAVNQAIAQLTPLAEDERHESARAQRSVEFFENGSGMTLMQALMTSFDAQRVLNVLEYAARNDDSLSGNTLTKMSDALVGILTGDLDMAPERRHGASQVNVVVSAETLLGLRDAPAQMVGSNVVLTANAVRELSETSRLRRMIVDTTSGALLELGRRAYEPSRQLKDHVKMRDRKCRAPGCVRNAMRCDVDHVQAWDDGGETNVDNLVALCRRHHVLKTIGTWQYELRPNGDTVWRLPNGHVVIDYQDPWIENDARDKSAQIQIESTPPPF